MSVSKLKQEVARSEYDARFAAADSKSRCIDRVLRRTSLHAPGSGLKSLGHSQDLLPQALCLIEVTFRLLSCGRDRRRNWPRTERRQKVSDAKSKKSVRSALQNTVGRVSRSRDLFLFGLSRLFYSLSSVSQDACTIT